MADLENLLLEAAGRTSAAVKNRHQLPHSRKRHGGSFSDDESDSGDEDSDGGRSYASKKPSQVPLKKRFDPAERGSDEEHVDDSDHESENSDESDIGPDLYKDDADRRRLSELTELEREMILTNRAEKKDGKKFMEKLRSKRDKERSIQSKKETSSVPLSRGLRSSARTAEKSAALDDALSQLREKRLKQQDLKARYNLRDSSKGSVGSQDISPIKRKSLVAPSLIDSDQNENAEGLQTEEVASAWDDDSLDSDEERLEPPTYQDIKDITIPRSKLAKWCMEPFFEELIVGCFVRVGFGKSSSGPVYRLCMVQNVDATDFNRRYQLEGKMTHKYLNCVWGSENSASKWQMAMVSNSAPEEEEFNDWVREVKRSAGYMPSKQDVLEKRETLQKSNTFVYSATTVKQMLQEKKASARPVNIAVEKDRLRRQLEVAESKCDEEEVGRIKTRLLELEASRQSQEKDSKAIRLAEMNRKNRFENFKNASGLKPINTNLKAGEAGYDPFSRRWTRSRNYFVRKTGGGDEAAEDETAEAANGTLGTTDNKAEAKVMGKFGMTATAAALEAAAGAGKLVDTSAPVDRATESYTLHNFELPISLAALQKFGGPHGAPAAYLARKQKIEATVGYQVPEDDGRRHALTLTVSDYKRRRGLL
ncbi:putative RNA polymerase-associated protein Rtf1 [Rosa chinensis]|uniref:Putative RNA polymerase-associated protein Rtf1 n=1 Tax=Rosa chinensis TaxID=74649 RepID=A0A2P6R7Q2_ROSCH|nr:protein RTF1 homolog [Rosa chinensis]XP_024187787.1 protein RTF1 homolog [Rosa chinensis]XP_040372213.1 protein RTF1 homolog [Rosa chinensis]PRQ42432.1 putative RNA polymerase-associated protein Rtf1 [Rosa chinensis]